jgi:hypothetical protein
MVVGIQRHRFATIRPFVVIRPSLRHIVVTLGAIVVNAIHVVGGRLCADLTHSGV